jgi:hypothetical protein
MNIAADLAALSLSSWLGLGEIRPSFAPIVEALTWKRSYRRPLFSITDRHERREVRVAAVMNVVTVPHAPPAVAAEEMGSRVSFFCNIAIKGLFVLQYCIVLLLDFDLSVLLDYLF